MMIPDPAAFEEKPIPLLIVHHRHQRYRETLEVLDDRFEITALDFRDPIPFDTHDARILLCWKYQDGLLERLPSLRWISALSAGVDHLLDDRDQLDDILITRAKGTMGAFLGEYALQHSLNHIKNFDRVIAQQDESHWRFVKSSLLSRITVGIYGAGSLGEEVGNLFSACGARVIGLKKSVSDADRERLSKFDQLYTMDQFKQMVRQADIHILLLPETDQTRGLFDHHTFASFKPGSLLINIGRGSLINDDDLIASLEKNLPARAILDVFDTEPLAEDSPLWSHPKVLVTPHCAGPSEEESLIREFIQQFESIAAGNTPERIVDFNRGY